MSAYLALARDHEPWPSGESRKRDLNHRLAAGPQASPSPSSSLCFNPAGSAVRQDTKADYSAHEHASSRLHEKTSFGQDLQDYQDYKSPKTLAHCKNLVNPVNPVKKDTSWGEELQLAYSWSREAQIQSAGTYGTVYV